MHACGDKVCVCNTETLSHQSQMKHYTHHLSCSCIHIYTWHTFRMKLTLNTFLFKTTIEHWQALKLLWQLKVIKSSQVISNANSRHKSCSELMELMTKEDVITDTLDWLIKCSLTTYSFPSVPDHVRTLHSLKFVGIPLIPKRLTQR